MTWSITIEPGTADTCWNRAKAAFDAASPNAPPEEVNQRDAIIGALKAFMHGLAPDPRVWVEGSAHGHANPDHTPQEGRAMDEINLTLRQVLTSEIPVSVAKVADEKVLQDRVDDLLDADLTNLKQRIVDAENPDEVRTLLEEMLKLNKE